ncbi:hypothetical protein CFN78_23150 [Amycolatopsis antarctica]|uniref:Type VII secretion system-associated protein n=1 Tax=Amycolatopsis antarctica TaxID=1854586 RepID=A0A263CXV5_9PSEU|nr:hypothetical protein CFN78_23150 [Amycolatopsis antarctica]
MDTTEGPLEDWFLLMDPEWRPSSADEEPPAESVVGLWPVTEGAIGKFRPNPDYVPFDANSPSDPLDAVLRLARLGRAETWHLQLMLRDTLCDVAMRDEDNALVASSPDEVPCAVVATAHQHRARIKAPGWRRVDLIGLAELLSDGVDVLFNPGAATSVRLTGDFVRETTLLEDGDFGAPDDIEGIEELRILRWEPGVPATPDLGGRAE